MNSGLHSVFMRENAHTVKKEIVKYGWTNLDWIRQPIVE